MSGGGWSSEELSPPGQNGNRARGANRPDGLCWPRDFSACPRVGLTDVPFEREFSSLGVWSESLVVKVHVDGGSGGFRVGLELELGIVLPHRPDDTSQFIGNGDGGLVVAAP